MSSGGSLLLLAPVTSQHLAGIARLWLTQVQPAVRYPLIWHLSSVSLSTKTRSGEKRFVAGRHSCQCNSNWKYQSTLKSLFSRCESDSAIKASTVENARTLSGSQWAWEPLDIWDVLWRSILCCVFDRRGRSLPHHWVWVFHRHRAKAAWHRFQSRYYSSSPKWRCQLPPQLSQGRYRERERSVLTHLLHN